VKNHRGTRGRTTQARPLAPRYPQSPRPPAPAALAGPAAPGALARHRRAVWAVWAGAAGALAALGAMLLVTGVMAQETPPAPPRDLGTIPAPGSMAPVSSPSVASTPPTRSTPTALPRSQPVSLAIPAIGVRTNVIDLGLNSDRTLQVPPLTQVGVKEAGWYDLGPTPGQLGPAVIAGHVDSYQGPGVFFRLGALRPGNLIDVTRADGTTAIFRVDAVAEYTKTAFPTQQVYGPVNYPGLRVITCGGAFDNQTHHYLSNIVIYATLTTTHQTKTKPMPKHLSPSPITNRADSPARHLLLWRCTPFRMPQARSVTAGLPGLIAGE
jgi:sortase (surface protein transpeptidase)